MSSLVNDMYRSFRAIEDFKVDSFARMDNHPGQAASLLLIRQIMEETGQDPKPSQLSEGARVMPATITSMLNKLEDRGLIRRECSTQDRREVLIRMTDEGDSLCNAVLSRVNGRFSRLQEFVGTEAMEQFHAFAQKVEEFNRLEAEESQEPEGSPDQRRNAAEWNYRRRRRR